MNGVVLGFLVLGIGLAPVLIAPFTVEGDTRQKRITIGWFFFGVSIDWMNSVYSVRLLGRTFQRRIKEKSSVDAQKREPSPEWISSSKGLRFFWGIVSHPSLVLPIVPSLARYFSTLLRSFAISVLEGELSLSDPVMNGICYGVVQGIQLPGTRLGVNFHEENWLRCDFRLQLFRVVGPTIQLLVALPYCALFTLAKEVFWTKKGVLT